MRWYIGMFSLIGAYTLVLFASVAEARSHQSSISCANLRCASGTCVDTPQGPVCQPSLSCANMLCAQGSICRETVRGPKCVNERPKSYTPPTYGKPSWPGQNSCYTIKDYAYGQSFYRTICPGDRIKPRKYRYHDGWRRYGNPYPGYTHPRPTPEEPRFCTKIYAPVCAVKKLQCFRAPCPPARQTFSNACMASNEGYSVVHKGPCDRRVDENPRPAPKEPKMCPQIYAPVCAVKKVNCFKAPCPPTRRTFSNACMAANEGYSVIYDGTCGDRG